MCAGQGRHSTDGRPRLLPSVVRLLMDGGLRYAPERNNPGSIEVRLGGRATAAAAGLVGAM